MVTFAFKGNKGRAFGSHWIDPERNYRLLSMPVNLLNALPLEIEALRRPAS